MRQWNNASAWFSSLQPTSKHTEILLIWVGDWRRALLRGSWIASLPEHLFLDYLVLPSGIAFVVSLWTIATYVFEDFDCFPYLMITSPTKRCGKTRFGEILELLCCRSIMSTNFSEAALFRSIHSEKPTVIIDEAEALSILSSCVRPRELLRQREWVASLDACQSSNPFGEMNGSPPRLNLSGDLTLLRERGESE